MEVYLDNMMVSALCGRSLADHNQQTALQALWEIAKPGRIRFRISREILSEIDRTKNPSLKEHLQAGALNFKRVERDHVVLGFQSQDLGFSGYITCPLVSDVVNETMFSELVPLGFKTDKEKRDARHFINAVENGCDVFLTNDPLFMRLRNELQARYSSTKMLTPTELLADLNT